MSRAAKLHEPIAVAFDALTIFVYNIGLRNFYDSTILRKLNERDYAGAAEQFPVWDRAGGREIPGLLNRREREQALFRGQI